MQQGSGVDLDELALVLCVEVQIQIFIPAVGSTLGTGQGSKVRKRVSWELLALQPGLEVIALLQAFSARYVCAGGHARGIPPGGIG